MSTDFEDTPMPADHEVKRFYSLAKRYPTFMLILKVIQRHRRLGRLQAIEAPRLIIEKEEELLQEGLDDLAIAFPPVPGKDLVGLPSIVDTLTAELERPHPTADEHQKH